MEGAMVSALTGTMNSLLCKLADLLQSEYKSLKVARKEVKFLESELRIMNALLQRLADMEEIDAQTKEWRDRVRELAYDVEDCVDLFMHCLGSINGKAGFMKKMGWKIKGLQVSHQITRQMQDLKGRVLEESERHKSARIRIDPRLSALYVEAERLVGIDGPRDKIIKWPMEKQGSISERLRTMSIVGCGVAGTTGGIFEDEQHLMNKLREYLQDKRHRIWSWIYQE